MLQVAAIVLVLFATLMGLLVILNQPLVSLLRVPQQVVYLLRGGMVRRNHAIQHATVHVLEERYGASRLHGYATTEGFRLRGTIEPAMLLDAAREGLLRLQRGDRALAIHSRCATSLATSHTFVSGLVMWVLAAINMVSLASTVAGLLLATLLTPTISQLAQRFITTSLDVKGMSIGGIELIAPKQLLGFALASGAEFAVRTKPARRIYQPPYRYGERVPVYVPVETSHRSH